MRISDWSSDVCSSDLKVARVTDDDAAVARWLRTLDKADDNDFRREKRGDETVTVNYTGAASILARTADAKPMSVALPGKGRAEERTVGKECGSTCSTRWSTDH